VLADVEHLPCGPHGAVLSGPPDALHRNIFKLEGDYIHRARELPHGVFIVIARRHLQIRQLPVGVSSSGEKVCTR
jgi:hypothetical protein